MATASKTGDVLERRREKQYMDDTTPLAATVVNYRTLPSHVEFVIRVQRGSSPEDSWEVAHRYSEFDSLWQALQQVSGISLPLPPKKRLGKPDRQFMVERQQGLQAFLDAVLADPWMLANHGVKKFLDPTNYSQNYHEVALRNVSMFFRSEPNWSIVEPLRDIGWRLRKQYYLIASKTDPKLPRHILSWSEPGPDSSLGERELEAAFKLLTEMKHPFILSPVSAMISSNGLMVVRQFYPGGSLRDLIYGVRPQGHVLQKYCQPAKRKQLSLADVRLYGRQVLEALAFLSEKSYVLGHVHAGNVIVDRGRCKLVDLENSLLGLPSVYRHHLLEIRKIYTYANEAVYGFGHMLYEMALGQPLKTPTMDSLPPSAPDTVVPILESILSPQGIKAGMPSFTDLLANPVFADVSGLPAGEKPSLRVPSKLKEVLKAHLEHGEQRLRDQQRKLAQQRRMSKVHENVMSEEEKKKRRKKLKKQMSLQESREPEAYPTTTSLPRQQTIATSQPATNSAGGSGRGKTTTLSNATVKAQSKSPTPKAPPPPAAAPPPQSRPPPSGERGALLSSISGFSKNKLKKAVTIDRSGPKV